MQREAPGKPSVRRMALLDAELVAYLVELSQVSFLVHHRRPVSKGGKRVHQQSHTAVQEWREQLSNQEQFTSK